MKIFGKDVSEQVFKKFIFFDNRYIKHIEKCSKCTCEKPCTKAKEFLGEEGIFREQLGIPFGGTPKKEMKKL